MFRFPYFGYPYGYPYYNYPNKYNNNYEPLKKEENASITDSNESRNTSRNSNSNSEQAIFEILGIKLYLDDIIILCILFFLYKEDVKDEMLYIILFLLLFS